MSLSSSSIRVRQVGILVKQDIARTLQGAHGQLFLIFFSLFWFWMLWQSSGGIAQSFGKTSDQIDEAWLMSWIFSKLFDGDQQILFVEHPATLSFYYVLAISTMPIFALLAASNQTAGDIGSKYLRFLIPRCTRMEIYLARFIGSSLVINCAYLVMTLCAAALSGAIDPNAGMLSVASYGLQITLSLLFYSLPFVAIMALCSASLGSASLSALTGTSIYSIVSLSVTFAAYRWPDAIFAGYLIPSVSKSLHLSLAFIDLMTAGFIAAVFVVIFAALGWQVFNKRDI
jgi:ABC-2 type transport system permease protein